MMKSYKANVLHAGKMNHQLLKSDLTAAQIIMLKAIHGDHAVTDIVETGNSDLPVSGEKGRLTAIYGGERFAAVFPGAFPQLPTDLAQVNIDYAPYGGPVAEEVKVQGETCAPVPSQVTGFPWSEAKAG